MRRVPFTFSSATVTGSRIASSTIDMYLRSRKGCSLGLPVPTRSQMRRLSRSLMWSTPTFVMMRRTAESVTLSGSEKNMCQRMSVCTTVIVSCGRRRSLIISLAILAPTTSWPWKVQSFFSSDQRRVAGLPMSWRSAARRTSNGHPLSAAACRERSRCSNTSNECA